MAEGLVTLAGSRLYTSAAYSEEMIDQALAAFDRAFANVVRLVKQERICGRAGNRKFAGQWLIWRKIFRDRAGRPPGAISSARLDESLLSLPRVGLTRAWRPDLVKVSAVSGKVLDGGYKPSSEAPMHALVYRHFPAVRVVAHTHQVYASAISLLDTDIAISAEWQPLLAGSCLPLSAYGLPGSKNLHRKMETTLAQTAARAILMSRHGAFVLAETTETCVRLARDLERFAISIYEDRLGRKTRQRPDINDDSTEEENLARALQSTSDEAVSVSTDAEVKPWLSRRLRPYLDDFAQICGVSAGHRRGSANVAFDPERGMAICYGQDLSEARNVRAVLEKNARAANIAELAGTPPLPMWEAWIMRLVYKLKYSKQAGR